MDLVRTYRIPENAIRIPPVVLQVGWKILRTGDQAYSPQFIPLRRSDSLALQSPSSLGLGHGCFSLQLLQVFEFTYVQASALIFGSPHNISLR